MQKDINYCQRCGNLLAEKEIEGTVRPHCPHCGFVVFLDPKIAAVVLVIFDEKLVMVKRGVEPALGSWAFPSGYVDRGEVLEEAAKREVKEETGLDIYLDHFIGMYSTKGNPVVLAVYSAHVIGGRMEAGHDAQEARLFSVDDLPPLPFPHDEQIISDWKAVTSDR